ncbi:DNA (cytosine-5)-methyltransferase 3B [Frankliniella fusca]|uniref:DNA (Cytosine-5)-methyltransferase 3B n=1 Tax=Frankliniella fusca TaxID=407009 RepID=A0AAE1H856_9NEOP|nr:DNA (cytosine-5)-methyltransferase 3B [Frankliniella fusca]
MSQVAAAGVSETPTLQDYLKPYHKATVSRLPTLTTSSASQRKGHHGKPPVESFSGIPLSLSVTEQEAVFGFRPHYTDTGHLSITQRRKLPGKSWCVPVVKDILKPLQSLFDTAK